MRVQAALAPRSAACTRYHGPMRTVDMGAMRVLFPGPLTNEQYFALPESNLHMELFEGKVLMAPAPTPEHQGAALRLARALLDYADRAGGVALIAPVDIAVEI